MRDMINNRIAENHLLFWTATGNLCKVTSITEGGLSISPGELTEPSVTIEITLALSMKGAPHGAEPILPGFIRVVDPASESVVARAMGRRTQ